jgi:hypothetical protein
MVLLILLEKHFQQFMKPFKVRLLLDFNVVHGISWLES